jgi:hypothetical protein
VYIVRDRVTKQIIHVNPAPLAQRLEGRDIYYQFDPKTMEVGRGELPAVPDHFHINDEGGIVPWTLQERVAAGLLKLPPHQKAVGDRIVEKTLAEQVAEGVVALKPTETVRDNRIVPKSLTEQVTEGLIKLSPTQIVDEDQIREMTDGEKAAAGLIKLAPHLKLVGKHISPKSRVEMAREGLVKLAPDEKMVGEQVVKLTPRQMLDEGRTELKQYKEAVFERHNQACLEARRKVLSDHELLYAAIGAVSQERVEECRTIAASYIKALEQVGVAIQEAVTADEVDAVAPQYERLANERPTDMRPSTLEKAGGSRAKKRP